MELDENEHVQINQKHFQCPICTTTPLSQIFQCSNGHMLCHPCILKAGPTCPQCRVPFGANKIRNLALEAILDDVQMSCLFRKYGCTQQMKRQDVIAHTKLCRFREVNICGSLGYQNCSTAVRFGKDLIEHLQTAHGVDEPEISNQTAVAFRVNTKYLFKKKLRTRAHRNRTRFMVQLFKTELNGEMEPFLLLVKMAADVSHQKSSNCVVLYLGDAMSRNADNFIAKIDVNVFEGLKRTTRICSWSGAPLHFKDAEDATVIPYVSTPIVYIKNRLDPGQEIFRLQVNATMELAGPYWVDGESSSEWDYSDDDSDGNEVTSTSCRVSKRRSELLTRPPPSKLMRHN